jgi:hypothetical protein
VRWKGKAPVEDAGVAGMFGFCRGKPSGEEGGIWVGGRGNADIIADAIFQEFRVMKEWQISDLQICRFTGLQITMSMR